MSATSTPPVTTPAATPVAAPGRPACHVVLDHVTRWYGDVIALNDVMLDFGPGVTGLLGPNGAGKTTMIRLIVGLATPGDGKVSLDGQAIRRNRDALARIGYVPDGDGLYEELTARRFLLDQAALRGFKGAAAATRVAECIELVNLGEFSDRRIGALSKGNRQKCKLAQALLHDPDVLVLDEPLTGLDPVMRRDVTSVVRKMGREGVTVVVSSHVLHEIEAMTDNIVLMRYGQVLAEGAVHDIRDTLDTHARRIRLMSDKPRDVARSLLVDDDLVQGVELQDDAVIVHTLHGRRLCQHVQASVAAGEYDVSALEPLDDDLRSVFAYLVS